MSPFSFIPNRSEEHTSELQSHSDLVCRLLLEKKTSLRRTARKRRIRTNLLNANPLEKTRRIKLFQRGKLCTFTTRVKTPAFFFNDTATTEIYTLSLHDALPI